MVSYTINNLLSWSRIIVKFFGSVIGGCGITGNLRLVYKTKVAKNMYRI